MQNKNLNSSPLFRSQGFGALITLFSLNGLFISTDLIQIFTPIRYSLLLVIAINLLYFLINLIKSNKIRMNEYFVFFFHTVIVIYGLSLSSISGGLFLNGLREYLFLILSLILTLFAFQENNNANADIILPSQTHKILKKSDIKSLFKINFNLLLPLLFFISPFILIATDTLVLTPLPRIAYDTISYKQSTTAFFAIGSIVFTFLGLSSRTSIFQLSFIILSFGMLAISMLGGARGELLVGVIVVLSMLIRKISLKNFFTLIVILLSFALRLLPNISEILNKLTVFKRFSVLSQGNFGQRDILIQQSINLLVDRTECLPLGCGFNFFQIYYGYDFGMYPHNLFAEILITYGVFLGGALILLIIFGSIYGFFSQHHRTFLYWIFLFFLGVSLKSGSLLGYYTITILIYFAYLGLIAIKKIAARLY